MYFIFIINENLLKLKLPDSYSRIIYCKLLFHILRTLEVYIHILTKQAKYV